MSNETSPEPIKIHFCIPPLKTKIKLASSWKFDLFPERRNKSLMNALGMAYEWTMTPNKATEVTLPANTLLTVDRIYVRQGVEDYNSVTFRIKKGDCPDAKFGGIRFWAKLYDVNTIVCFPIGGKDNEFTAKFFQSFGIVGQRLLDLD